MKKHFWYWMTFFLGFIYSYLDIISDGYIQVGWLTDFLVNIVVFPLIPYAFSWIPYKLFKWRRDILTFIFACLFVLAVYRMIFHPVQQ